MNVSRETSSSLLDLSLDPTVRDAAQSDHTAPAPLVGEGKGEGSPVSAGNVSRETSSSLPDPSLAAAIRDAAQSDRSAPSPLVGEGKGEGSRRSRRRRIALPALARAVGAILVAACGAPPGPQGWAAPAPIKLDNAKVVLVPHKAKLYALPDGSSTELWEFPPKDKNTYPVSTETRDNLKAALADAGLDDAARKPIAQKIDELKVSGPTAADLKTAITNTGASVDAKDRLKKAIDDKVGSEKKSFDGLKALYGDLGVSADSKTAFVSTFKGELFALDTATGQTRWIHDAGAGMVGGVAVDGDAIYFGTKGKRVFALDAKSARQLWQFDTKGEIWATPAVDGGTVFVTSLDGSVYALDKASGQKKWVFNGAGSGIAARPVVSGDAVYVGSFDNKLYSIKTADGALNWSLNADNWFWASPVVQGNVVYAAALDGKVYAVDASSGQAAWPKPFDTGAAIRSSPVIAGDALIVASRNGKVFKLGLQNGDPSEGSPVTLAGTSILSNLTLGGDNTVLVSPTSSALFIFDASRSALEAPGNVPLPQ